MHIKQSLAVAHISIDQKMNYSQASQDLQDLHEQVCSLIVSTTA